MQIRAVTVNAVGTAAGRNVRGNRNQAQPVDSTPGVSCRVTISQEGKRLSRQQEAHAARSTQSVKAERMLLRWQEQSEQDKKIEDGYRDTLKNIENKISALNSSYKNKADGKTIEKEQEVLEAMRNQKQAQMEENQRRAQEAQQMAMQSAEYQEEIDDNNRELLTLLKTMEEAEKAEDEQENGEAKAGGNGSGTSGTKNSVSDVIQNSAAQFMASSVKRECGVEEAIAGLGDEGRQLLDMADTITRNVLNETENIRTALDDELYTDERIAEMMNLLQDGTSNHEAASGYGKRGRKTGMELNYDDVENYRGHGLHILQKAQEYKIQHIADDPLGGMQEARRSMMLSAVDAALGEARQGSLDEASRELEDEVERLIDERNDVDRIRQDREQYEEEQEEKAKEQEGEQ